MEIKLPGIYHIYNRGNNKQPIFFSRDNYYYFIEKCDRLLKPNCDILGWCLLPNHFHFLVDIASAGLAQLKLGSVIMPAMSNSIRILLSSYAKGINRQEGRTGSLFQQKTQAKSIQRDGEYLQTVLTYIHQNPVKAGLVNKCGDWPYSSYNEYLENQKHTLCNKIRANELFNFDPVNVSDTCVRRLL